MQYQTGTVSVTNGSNQVVGVGTSWLANVNVGNIFTIPGSGAWYEVASITDDTHLVLTANYGGATAAGSAYAITRDFTVNYGFPYPEKGDVDTQSILKRALQEIDTELARIEALIP